ncbi:hypothetical protein MO867_11400 [Microbulbifer sp. OS29]|uniref:Uncharacterized protein n=1 Tax=Microbulbifer okhotskensis TaxID=2926617 RepID=A0A9X2ENJ8_9GAMM|nr:hypothetical protein [Microbulbifer okhotskensis]MCO1334944.1 hypothetical protein [Microbulbifer okhotskensis]
MIEKRSQTLLHSEAYFLPRNDEALYELFGRDISRRVVESFLALQDVEYFRCVSSGNSGIYTADQLLIDCYAKKINEQVVLDEKLLFSRAEFEPIMQAYREETAYMNLGEGNKALPYDAITTEEFVLHLQATILKALERKRHADDFIVVIPTTSYKGELISKAICSQAKLDDETFARQFQLGLVRNQHLQYVLSKSYLWTLAHAWPFITGSEVGEGRFKGVVFRQFDLGWRGISSELDSDTNTNVFVITDASCSGGEAEHIRNRLLRQDRHERSAIIVPLCRKEALCRLDKTAEGSAEIVAGVVLDDFKRQWKDVGCRASYKVLRGREGERLGACGYQSNGLDTIR